MRPKEKSEKSDGAQEAPQSKLLMPRPPTVAPSYIGDKPPLGEGTTPENPSFAWFEAAGTYETGGVGPCLGMLIYDPERHGVLVLHAYIGSHEILLNQALKELGVYKPGYRAYLCGMVIEAEEEDGYSIETLKGFRASALKILEDYGLKPDQMFVCWGKPKITQSLIINLPDGDVNLLEVDFSEWYDEDFE